MTGQHRIRPATAEDAEALAVLIHEMGGFRAFEGATLDEVRSAVRGSVAATLDSGGSTFLVVEDAGSVVGWAQVHWVHDLFLPGPEGYLTELFLADAQRGRGIGSEVLELIVEEARRRDAYRLTLLNGRERASYARGFYAARGWTERDDVASFVLYLRD